MSLFVTENSSLHVVDTVIRTQMRLLTKFVTGLGFCECEFWVARQGRQQGFDNSRATRRVVSREDTRVSFMLYQFHSQSCECVRAFVHAHMCQCARVYVNARTHARARVCVCAVSYTHLTLPTS